MTTARSSRPAGARKGASARKSAQRLGRVAVARLATTFVTQFMKKSGLVGVEEVAAGFGISKGQLAETVGIQPETLHRASRVAAPKTQARVREMLEIIGRVESWAGGRHQAMAWYRAEPIPAFGGRTAESLVKEGKATAVRDFLDHVALGGFA